MQGNEYQAFAMRTKNERLLSEDQFVNAALGLAGEAGEFADHIKKFMFQGHNLDKDYLVKELGDIMWYVALACDTLNIGLDEVMKKNVIKLTERYPQGFAEELSVNRVL